jgi:hypothetical protein
MIRRLAANAALRTVLQGLLVTALAAGWAAARATVTGSGSVPWLHVGMVAVQAAGMAVLAYAGRTLLEHHAIALPADLDAWIRAGRTLLAGLAATVAAAVWQAVAAAVAGGTFNPGALAQTVGVAAGMAAAAWLHRLLLDPSPVPSAVPPAPGGTALAPPLGPGATASGRIVDLGGGQR